MTLPPDVVGQLIQVARAYTRPEGGAGCPAVVTAGLAERSPGLQERSVGRPKAGRGYPQNRIAATAIACADATRPSTGTYSSIVCAMLRPSVLNPGGP
jgi:hypothetical protein